jgi:hypothetical protein
MSEADYVLNKPFVVSERLDGEVIAISNQSGKYFSFGNTAADIWYLLQNPTSRKKWLEILSSNYENVPESAEEEIQSFLSQILEEGLIKAEAISSSEVVVLPSDSTRGKWVKPEAIIFDDLQDLLLVDPIHDTTEAGWPFKENG